MELFQQYQIRSALQSHPTLSANSLQKRLTHWVMEYKKKPLKKPLLSIQDCLPQELWDHINWFNWQSYIQESFETMYQKEINEEQKYWISQLMQSQEKANGLKKWYQEGCPLPDQQQQAPTPSASP